jgi:hypothetical protein
MDHTRAENHSKTKSAAKKLLDFFYHFDKTIDLFGRVVKIKAGASR